MTDISRHVIGARGRRVHYRRAGRGPAVVALHGSPDSSAALTPLIEKLSERFTVIAPDSPGNGLSAPLDHTDPDSSDFADGVKAFADALGLDRFGLYGFHTGAGIAMDVALTCPDRVSALALDGYAVWTETERALLLDGYLNRFEPSADGSHLAALWTRLEDQAVFFPWHRKHADAYLVMDAPSPAIQARRAVDWMTAGDAYRAIYRSAFRRRGEIGPDRATVPALIGASPPDPLLNHLDRLGDLPEGVRIERWTKGRAQALDHIANFLACHPGTNPPAAPASSPVDGLEEGYAAGLRWRGRMEGRGRPLVLLHGAGASSALFEPCMARLAVARDVIALDLPGHGFSSSAPVPQTLSAWTSAIEAALETLGGMDWSAAGHHLGGLVAAGLKARGRASVAALVGAPVFTRSEAEDLGEKLAPSLIPDPDGAFLLAAWRRVRRQTYQWPWYDGSATARLAAPAPMDADILHRQTTDLLIAGSATQAGVQAMISDAGPALIRQAGEIVLLTLEWDGLSDAKRSARLAGIAASRSRALPGNPADWAREFASL